MKLAAGGGPGPDQLSSLHPKKRGARKRLRQESSGKESKARAGHPPDRTRTIPTRRKRGEGGGDGSDKCSGPGWKEGRKWHVFIRWFVLVLLTWSGGQVVMRGRNLSIHPSIQPARSVCVPLYHRPRNPV